MKKQIFRIEEREGSQRRCPYCNETIKYTKLNTYSQPLPFFYAENSNDILLRNSDKKKVLDILSEDSSNFEKLENVWMSILKSAPLAPDGSCFGLWSNIKCPHCFKEFPYNNGVKDLFSRIREPNIILVDGASIIGDSDEESWTVSIQSD